MADTTGPEILNKEGAESVSDATLKLRLGSVQRAGVGTDWSNWTEI